MPDQPEWIEEYSRSLNDIDELDASQSELDPLDEIYRSEQVYVENSANQAHLKQLLQNIGERKKYASRIFWLVCGWLGFVGIIVFISGLEGHLFGGIRLSLPESVIIALITTTTINVIGIFLFVMRYLFSTND